jgi:hypothetical protein
MSTPLLKSAQLESYQQMVTNTFQLSNSNLNLGDARL